MTASQSPLARAIDRVSQRGWFIRGLGRSPIKTSKPWSCDVHPAHFKDYQWGDRQKIGGYGVYPNAMIRLTGQGATALEAVEDAIAILDASKEKRLYNRLEQILQEWADGFQS